MDIVYAAIGFFGLFEALLSFALSRFAIVLERLRVFQLLMAEV